MRKPNRDIQVFSLSALDVLAMATGAFVVLMTLLMPYYRRTQDAQAEISNIRVAVAAELSRAAELEAGAARDAATASRLMAEAEAASARADSLARRIAEVEERVGVARAASGGVPREQDDPRSVADTSVVEELDIVFVMDTTRSMTPALGDLAQSLSGIVRVLERLVPSVRIGFVAYTDRDTGYQPIRALSITDTATGMRRILAFVDGLGPPPRGSRTIEEDVDLGIQRALAMKWRSHAKQVMVLIGDAPAHLRFRNQAFMRVDRFVRGNENRAVSALFVSTPSSRSRGDLDREFFVRMAKIGRGNFNDHTGHMFESVILAVLTPAAP
jgi:hypothetical protein